MLGHRQSTLLENREELENKIEYLRKNIVDNENVSRPPYWGGFLINYHKIEFWEDSLQLYIKEQSMSLKIIIGSSIL